MTMPVTPDTTPPGASPTTPGTKPRRWILPAVILVLVLVAGGVAAWALTRDSAASPSTPTTIQVSGHLTLRDFSPEGRDVVGFGCSGDGGYSDIHGGAQVIITNPSGTVVGVDIIVAGVITEPGPACTFGFVVQDVPLGHRFYGIAIGNRRPIQIAEADLSAPVELSLG